MGIQYQKQQERIPVQSYDKETKYQDEEARREYQESKQAYARHDGREEKSGELQTRIPSKHRPENHMDMDTDSGEDGEEDLDDEMHQGKSKMPRRLHESSTSSRQVFRGKQRSKSMDR